MLACVDGMESDQEFKRALGDARSSRMTGPHLEPYDHDGVVVARFEAGAMP